jgi:hypothetical protein
MPDSKVVPAVDLWLSFRDEYRRRVPIDPAGIAAYQLFTSLRDAGMDGWIKEPLKALHFAWLRRTGTDVEQIHLDGQYDYCFIIDGIGASGLSTSYPVLRALPPGRRALLVVRDHVVRDSRFREIARSPAFGIVNIDRARVPAGQLACAPREMYLAAREFPGGSAILPKLTLRRLHFGFVLERILARTAIGYLVVSNERLILSSAAIHAARRHGVHTVCLQHGALVEQYLPVTVDTYLTWGVHASNWVRRQSVSARLCDIGAPRTDELAQFVSQARPCDPGRAPRQDTIIAFFSQRPGVDMPASSYVRVEREFLALLDNSTRNLLVKLHPSDDARRWTRMARTAPQRLRLVSGGGDPYRVIAEADYVGAFYSTVLLEAMLFAKPVFQLNPFGDEVPDYSRRGGCSPISDGRSLAEWIQRCDTDPAFYRAAVERQRAYAADYFSNLGQASAAFYACLDATVPGSRPTR